MNTLLAGVTTVGILSAACSEKDTTTVLDATSMNEADCRAIIAAIQAQYATILSTYNTKESLILRLCDHSATLVMTVQDGTIIMAQLVPRNPYPNDPDMAPTPYTDIHGDGILDTYPADTRTLPQSSLTYGNYLSLLTRFGIPQEVIQESIVPEKNLSQAQ